MNQLDVIDSDATDRVNVAANPGTQLRAQRQARGIEIERIATQLHLRKDVVEALEQDRYDALPAPVYVAGYLRNYARLLDLDSTTLIQAYHTALSSSAAVPSVRIAAMPSAPPPVIAPAVPEPVAVEITALSPAPAPISEPTSAPVQQAVPPVVTANFAPRRSALPLLIGIGAVLALLALGGYYRAALSALFAGDGLTASAPTTDAEPAATPDLNESASEAASFSTDAPPPEPAADAAPAVTPDEDLPQPTPAVTPSPLPNSTAAPALVVETAASAGGAATAAVPMEVVLEFASAAWLSVTGADGRSVLTGKMHQGERRVLKGQPPYQFVMGKANAVKMTVNGQPFDVMAHARGNVARFSLDPAATTPATSDDE